MTLASTVNKHVYTASGTNRFFPYSFSIIDSTDIEIYVTDLNDAIVQISANFTIDEDNLQVIYPTVASGLPYVPDNYRVTILRNVPQTQGIDWQNQGYFNAEVLESSLDKLTMLVQQIQEILSRTIRYPVDREMTNAEADDFLTDMAAAATSAAAALVSEIAALASKVAAAISETNAVNAAASVEGSGLRLTTIERDALIGLTEGDTIFNLDIHKHQFWDAITWQTISSS